MNKPRVENSVYAPQVVSKHALEIIEERAQAPAAGLRTGIKDVDEILNPHRAGELRIVLGYTSNYKSGMMNYICRYNAKRFADDADDSRVAITVTWEQSIDEQGVQDISQLSAIDITQLMRGELTETDWMKLRRASVERGNIPWWLVGHSIKDNRRRPRLSMTDLSEALAYLVDVQQVEIGIISLDYLQRIKREGKSDTRIQYMDIVDRAKDMALAYNCPVMLGTQAGRQTKSRQWRLPQTDDGQETSNLEQSADSLLSVWMPKNDYAPNHIIEYGDKVFTVNDNLLILGVMKQKFGPAPRIFDLHVRPEINEIGLMVKGQYV